jgi:predicted O-methyltransferase YrrM
MVAESDPLEPQDERLPEFGSTREALVLELADLLAAQPEDDRRALCDAALRLAAQSPHATSTAAGTPAPSAPPLCARRLACSFGLSETSIASALAELSMSEKYLPTFAEYELVRVRQLLELGEARCASMLAELGVTPNDIDRLIAYVFNADRPNASCGALFSPAWLRVARDLYSPHMGCENMGPLLYQLVRFFKPSRALEIGAGYTSIFLLQALADNDEELRRFSSLERAGACPGFLVASALEAHAERAPSILHCVDNLAHEQTTAHRVIDAARQLGIESALRFIEADAWRVADDWPEGPAEQLDLLWFDFGAGGRLAQLLAAWWPRLALGGLLIVHSSLTNAMTRAWLETVRKPAPGTEPPLGEVACLSLLEPHKRYQNSCTILQKRGPGYAEPIYTNYP